MRQKWLTPQQVAAARGISVELVYRWIWQGRMKAELVDRRWRVDARSAKSFRPLGPGQRGPDRKPRSRRWRQKPPEAVRMSRTPRTVSKAT